MSEYPRIDVSVDAVVFGYQPGENLSVLLIRRKNDPYKGCWALPGGFVEADEALDKAAFRELKEETGIEPDHLEQLYAFGDPKRDPRKRVVSIAHFTIVKKNDHHPQAADDAESLAWRSIEKLPALAFDHSLILEMAMKRLKATLQDKDNNLFKSLSTAEKKEALSCL